MDLQAALRGQGRKQRWLAARLGISESVLSRKLRGERHFTRCEAEMAARHCPGLPVEAWLRNEPVRLPAPRVVEVAS